MKKQEHYEVIIIGGSYSGLAAGMALGRASRKVLLIDNGKPCNIQAPHSHNFLTHDGKAPKEITAIARLQVEAYDTVTFFDGTAIGSTRHKDGFEVTVSTGETFNCRKIIFATGIKDIMPGIDGFADCWGISALHCPYCHGYEVKNATTGILGSGENDFEFASLISNWTDKLALYTNGKPTLSHEQVTKLKARNIHIVETGIRSLQHDNGKLQHIIFENGNKVPLEVLYARRPFAQHCDIPLSLGCELTIDGYIKIDPSQHTTVPGVLACGDNTTRMRTVANAVAMGTTAGMMANKQLIEENL